MKFKSTLCLICLAMLSMQSFAQKPVLAPTTEDEYNFCVRGYQVQTSSGLDMKKGYSFRDIFTDKKVDNYQFTAKLLIRDDKKEVAAILIIAKSLVWNKTYFHCIPHENEKLLETYWQDLGAWDKPMLLAYSKIIAAYFGSLVPATYELEKRIK